MHRNYIVLKRYSLNPKVVISEIAGETVAVPLVNSVAQMNKVFTLNQTAAFIIQVITNQPKTLDEIANALSDEFEIDKNLAKQDIIEVLNQGIDLSLITTDDNE